MVEAILAEKLTAGFRLDGLYWIATSYNTHVQYFLLESDYWPVMCCQYKFEHEMVL